MSPALATLVRSLLVDESENMFTSFIFLVGSVFEYVLGENKFTFVEECKNPQSVTILLKAPNKHSLVQMKARRKN